MNDFKSESNFLLDLIFISKTFLLILSKKSVNQSNTHKTLVYSWQKLSKQILKPIMFEVVEN